MNLKRERNDEDSQNYHARKKLRIRIPIIPRVKAEEPFVAYNHLDTIEYLYAHDKDEEWHEEDDYLSVLDPRKPRATKKLKIRGPKKETSFRNIFWGTQQSAWMGSVRQKGTIVRSCSRKSDVLAARILNTRCKEKGIIPPNPEAGFLSSAELSLKTHSQTFPRGKKKTDFDALGKQKQNLPKKPRKKPRRSSGPSRSSPFKNIFWGTQQKAWMGNIRVKGTIVRSCSRKSDVQAAKILNSRCRAKGIDPPNPDIGFIDSKLESKYLGKNCKTERSNDPVSGQYINDLSMQFFVPLDSVKIEKDFDFKLEKIDSTCSYDNVFWSNYEQAWIGSYQTSSGRVLTVKTQENALTAAKMLNSRCRDACISNPNPHAGFVTNDEPPSSDFYIKDDFLKNDEPFSDFHIKAETTISDSFNDDFQDFFKPLNDFSTSRTHLSLETVELPPPVLDEEDFKSMNNLMFKYISDLLPEHTRKYHEQRTSSLFDDLPLNSILL